MSHNASDAQKLISVDSITATPGSGSPWSVTKGLTSSNPSGGGIRYFMLQDPTTIPAGMSFEIKDSAGTAGGGTTKIIVQAPGSVTIDGSTDDDEITKNWGSKTYVSTGTGYVVRGDQRAISAIASGGGSLLVDFGGLDGAALPTGWSSTTSGTGIDWLISTDTFHADGSNVSSAGSDHDPDSTSLGSATTTSPAISTLTYNAGTLAAGKVVTFRWLRDTYDASGSVYNTTGNHSKLHLHVNGVLTTTHSSRGNWQTYSYTVPSTGTYAFSWEWYRVSVNSISTSNNGCFIDEFEILDAPAPSYSNSFDGAEEAALPTGWTATTTGTWPADSSGWLHSTDTYYPGGASVSCLGDHYDGAGTSGEFPADGTSTLSYAAGTLNAGDVVSWAWMKDFPTTSYKPLTMRVNGVVEKTFSTSQSNSGVWMTDTYTIPTTGVYTIEFHLHATNHYFGGTTGPTHLNGCFVDEFSIT